MEGKEEKVEELSDAEEEPIIKEEIIFPETLCKTKYSDRQCEYKTSYLKDSGLDSSLRYNNGSGFPIKQEKNEDAHQCFDDKTQLIVSQLTSMPNSQRGCSSNGSEDEEPDGQTLSRRSNLMHFEKHETREDTSPRPSPRHIIEPIVSIYFPNHPEDQQFDQDPLALSAVADVRVSVIPSFENIADNGVPASLSIPPSGTPNYVCVECEKEFRDRERLLDHLDKHHADGIYLCSCCDERFSGKAALNEHLSIRVKNDPNQPVVSSFKCDECDKAFPALSFLKRHKVVHATIERPFECSLCGKRYTDKRALRRHRMTHTGQAAFKCEVCNKTFTRKETLKSHSRRHTREQVDKPAKPVGKRGEPKERLFTPEVKPIPEVNPMPEVKSVGKSPELKEIRRKPSEGESCGKRGPMKQSSGKRFKCDQCEKCFSSRDYLKKHQSWLHSKENRYTCKVCSKSFSYSSTLKNHSRLHTGERPFECEVCNRKFSQKIHLKNHQVKHTGAKPFKCEVCEKLFTQKSSMLIHQRSHTGEKPYKCDQCDESFTYRLAMKNHKRFHDEDSVYECEECETKFLTKYTLQRHVARHGPKKKGFECEECRETFLQVDDFEEHKRAHMAQSRECDVGKKMAYRGDRLEIHQTAGLHTGEELFECIQSASS